MRLPRVLAPLAHPGFRLLFTGQLASNVGDAFYAIALPWYVLSSHGGAVLLATVLAAYGVPRTVFVAFGGHVADRFGAWSVMMVADVVRTIAVALLAAVAISGPASASLLVPLAAVIGAGEGLFLPGSVSIIPRLLPDDELQSGNGLSSSGTQLATFLGPAIGGAVVALTSSGVAFAIDAGTFFLSAGTLAGIWRLKRAEQRPVPVEGGPAQTIEGEDSEAGRSEPVKVSLMRLIRSERILKIVLVTTLAANIGSGGLGEVALPALARGPFRAGAGGYGGLIAALGLGALIGTIVAGQKAGLSRPAVVASVIFLVEGCFMALVPYLGGAVPGGVALFVFGGLNGFGNVVIITALQRWGPPAALGRLMGLVMLMGFGLFPVSVLLGGWVVHTVGPALFFPLAAAPIIGAVLYAISNPEWRAFGTAPHQGGGGAAPDTRTSPEGQLV